MCVEDFIFQSWSCGAIERWRASLGKICCCSVALLEVTNLRPTQKHAIKQCAYQPIFVARSEKLFKKGLRRKKRLRDLLISTMSV